MRVFPISRKVWLFTGVALIVASLPFVFHSKPVDFNTEVKPIINRNCISCHGGVRAKGGFSLLFREDAFAKTKSGKAAIVPGDPDHSELIRRLTSSDPEDRMPYHHPQLSPEEITTLRKWIKQGAPWGEHWAYVPVKNETPPDVGESWVHNDIDKFVFSRLEEQGLHHSEEADRPTLLRRVSLDLTGVYPSERVASAYLNGGSYETLVDSLLASPHFGERWASVWMDLARYADTKGYERDDSRQIWRYRDWLIRAFNADMPYNEFITEQIAGDLLPHPTEAQFIATAYHRNTMTNDEGGTDNEEFRTAAVLDRVNATWEGLMGTTFACVQCHSHPYDPFHHEDYYKFMAYFNNSRDEDTYADYPLYRSFPDSLQQKLSSLKSWIAGVAGPERAAREALFLQTWQPSINSLTSDRFVGCELNDTKWLACRRHASARLRHVDLTGREELIYSYTGYIPGGTWKLHLDTVTGPVICTVRADTTHGWTFASTPLAKATGFHDLYITYDNPSLKDSVKNAVMFDWFHFTQSFPGRGTPGYDASRAAYWKLLTARTQTTPVMMDNPADMYRPSYVFERGNWLTKGAEVKPAVPAVFRSAMPAKAPQNRLGLAMWLTNDQNPLVSRTIVNRLWEQLFGQGIVETLEDMGSQGITPTHRELLDHLAFKLMHTDGWKLKPLLREIVLSATYRQDSKLNKESLQKDPSNKWLARGARVRLSAEQVRDQALCISGRLSETMYGPSVFPFQPDGIWLSPWNGASWKVSDGPQKFRRALYTYWKRTASYPSMISFDATSREVCLSRRIRTNTPLQALVTLNDPTYLELARQLASFMMDFRETPRAQIARGYEHMEFKPIAPAKLDVLAGLYDQAYASFSRDKQKLKEFREGTPAAAAMTVVANAMLNLDEVITKN